MNLSKKNKLTLLVVLVITSIGFSLYKYSLKPPTKISHKKVDFVGSASELLNKIQKEATLWQDKVVIISGKITKLDSQGMIISPNIYCQFQDSLFLKTIQLNDTVSIKGRVIGYDDLFEELKLDQCLIQ